MKRLSAGVLCLALAASACSGDDDAERDRADASASPATSAPGTSASTPTSSPTPSGPASLPTVQELGHDPAARKELRRALVALLQSNTGTYTLDFGTSGSGLQERASYQIEPRAFEIRRYLSAEDGTYTFDFRAVGPSAWMRSVDAPGDTGSWPCWLDVADLSADADGQLGQLLTSDVARTQPPNPVVAASYAVGREYSEVESLGSILGTLDLVTATALLGSQAVLKLGLDPESDGTVPTYFDVHDGTLRGFTVGLRALFLALDQAGAELPVDPSGPVPGQIVVRFADQGEPVSVVPPDPREVVDVPAGQDDFKDEMAACGAR